MPDAVQGPTMGANFLLIGLRSDTASVIVTIAEDSIFTFQPAHYFTCIGLLLRSAVLDVHCQAFSIRTMHTARRSQTLAIHSGFPNYVIAP